MTETLGQLGKRAVAGLVLVAVAFVAFKLLVGLLTAVAWVAIAVVALVAVVWALRVLT